MKRFLILLMTLAIVQNCGSQPCKHYNEIQFIYNIPNESDIQNICESYEHNRESFLKFKNDSKDYGVNQVEEILTKANISPKSISAFIDSWQISAKEHRILTKQRDSVYFVGVNCLQLILKEKESDFNKFIEKNRRIIESSLTENQIQTIRKGIINYREFNSKKKEEFLKEETLQYSKLGINIILYNQLSFDVIDKFMSSQYSFGLKNNYSEQLISFYDENSILKEAFAKYRQIEEDIVQDITTDQCFKRIGILRYYDGLDDGRKEKAKKVNMLMNMFK